MNKSKYKQQQIGTISKFSSSKKQQSIKENSQLSIEVGFWDEAVRFAVDDLRSLAGGGNPINWNNMVEQIKRKFNILNIYDKTLFTDESFIMAYVKDILYHNYKDSFISGDVGGTDSYSSEEMGTKALVLSKLADAVLQKVKVEAEIVKEPEPEVQKTVATVSLEAGWGEEDYLPFEQRSVAGFNDFANRLKESVERIQVQDNGKGLDYCLNKIEMAAGSIKPDDIQKVIQKKGTTLKGYLFGLADEYVKTASIRFNEPRLPNNGNQRQIFIQAQKMYSHEIVRKLMGMIKKENPGRL